MSPLKPFAALGSLALAALYAAFDILRHPAPGTVAGRHTAPDFAAATITAATIFAALDGLLKMADQAQLSAGIVALLAAFGVPASPTMVAAALALISGVVAFLARKKQGPRLSLLTDRCPAHSRGRRCVLSAGHWGTHHFDA